MNLYFHLNFDQCRISRNLTDEYFLEGSFEDGKILDLEGNCIIMERREKNSRINSLLNIFNIKFYLFGKTQNKVSMKSKNLFVPSLMIGEFEGKDYSIKMHTSYKYSIFENDNQIALLDKIENPILGKTSLKLSYNSNINAELLVGFVFCTLKIRTNGFDGRYLLTNLYSIHKFDSEWRAD